jgi:excisionase family DNA binding protein
MKTKESKAVSHSNSECWINTSTACKHLAISPATIHRWIRTGKLKPKRTPTGEHRYRRSELDALLD